MIDIRTNTIRLRTDFNDATEDEATALSEGVYVTMLDGTPVELFDADGNTCYGVAERMIGGLVYVRPDWESWRDAPEVNFPEVDITEALFVTAKARVAELAETS